MISVQIRRTYVDAPLPTFDAIDELVGLGVVFVLFRHARTGEAVVVHRRDDRRLALLFPPGSVLADEDDDGHGKVISLRRDGDYGLVEAG